jgi:gluconokinase
MVWWQLSMKKHSQSLVVVIMGVAGCGKSTVGMELATRLSCQFSDADDFHTAESKAKMAAGVPLTDSDREPWLYAMKDRIENWLADGTRHVLACSALKESYRQILQANDTRVHFVYLKASPDLVESRLKSRQNHYMKTNMLESQFQALEEPAADAALTVNADEPVPSIVRAICSRLAQITADEVVSQAAVDAP